MTRVSKERERELAEKIRLVKRITEEVGEERIVELQESHCRVCSFGEGAMCRFGLLPITITHVSCPYWVVDKRKEGSGDVRGVEVEGQPG